MSVSLTRIDTVTITNKSIIFCGFQLLLKLGLSIFYTYSYNELPNEIRPEKLAQLFLTFIILYWIITFLEIVEFFHRLRCYGETIPVNIFNSTNPVNSGLISRLKTANLAAFIVVIWIMTYVIPFKKNCQVLSDYKNACASLRTIAILELSFIVLFLSIFSFTCCFLCSRGLDGLDEIISDLNNENANVRITIGGISERNDHGTIENNNRRADQDYNYYAANPNGFRNNNNNNSNLNRSSSSRFSVRRMLSTMILSNLPISTTPPDDKTCSICLVEATDTDQQQWKMLPCQHKFHPACIDEWLKSHITCPLCRKSVNVINNV